MDRVTIPEPLCNKIASLANVSAQLRSTVSRDAYDKHVNYQPDIERPARLAKAFAKLLKGLAVVRGKHEVTVEEYDLIVKVALDTIPRRRRAIVSYLVGSDWRNTKTIATDLQLPSTTAQYELEDLMLIKVVNREADVADGDELRQTTPYKWHLSENVARLIEDTGLKAVI